MEKKKKKEQKHSPKRSQQKQQKKCSAEIWSATKLKNHTTLCMDWLCSNNCDFQLTTCLWGTWHSENMSPDWVNDVLDLETSIYIHTSHTFHVGQQSRGKHSWGKGAQAENFTSFFLLKRSFTYYASAHLIGTSTTTDTMTTMPSYNFTRKEKEKKKQ